MVLSVLLLVSMVTEASVAPLAMTLFGVVVKLSSVLIPYIKSVVVLCVLAGAVLAVIIPSVANEPPVASLVVAVPKRLSVEAVEVSDVELVAAVSLTMSVTPSDEGEGRSDAVGFESSAAVREESYISFGPLQTLRHLSDGWKHLLYVKLCNHRDTTI